jgi:hypothetical protein
MNEELHKLVIKECEQYDTKKKEIAEKEKELSECFNQMIDHVRVIFGVDRNESVEHQIANRWKLDQFGAHNMQPLLEHWQIYLASIITVKHTISFSGSNFAANALFGFKQIRCHSSFYPFRLNCQTGYPKLENNNVLRVSDSMTYELGKWFKHRSIDQSKLPLLFELTKDICELIRERNEFVTPEVKQAFSFVKGLYDSYQSADYYRAEMKKIEDYYNKYYGSIELFNKLNDRRKQLEDKWDVINKNYKLIIKLSNKKLKV